MGLQTLSGGSSGRQLPRCLRRQGTAGCPGHLRLGPGLGCAGPEGGSTEAGHSHPTWQVSQVGQVAIPGEVLWQRCERALGSAGAAHRGAERTATKEQEGAWSHLTLAGREAAWAFKGFFPWS